MGASSAAAAAKADPASKSRSDQAAGLRKRARKTRSASNGGKWPVDGMLWNSNLGSQKMIDDERIEWSLNAAVPVEPGNPRSAVHTMPRGKRVWMVERLSTGPNAMITSDGFDAALRFREEWFLAEYGVRSGRSDDGVRVDPWSRLPFSERRAMCRQSVAMAATKIGPRAFGLVRWCVLEVTPEGHDHQATAAGYAAYAKRDGWDIAKVVGALAMTLDVLAVHYGFTRPERATIAPGRKEGDGS